MNTEKELQDKCSEVSGTPFDYFKAGYDFAQIKWHKFPDELPEDAQDVLTVAINPKTKRQFYHTLSFMGKIYVKTLLKEHRKPSAAFLQWNDAHHYEVVAWCELPAYKETNV